MRQFPILSTPQWPIEEKSVPEAIAPRLKDIRLADRVECALLATGYSALRNVRVTVDARIVVLGGQVSSYYLKQVAQATAQAVPGAHQIRNDLHVVHSH
ncbi:MAG: BON domain-containing protein [Pirellulales bacterium]